jgi:hypothetical protein
MVTPAFEMAPVFEAPEAVAGRLEISVAIRLLLNGKY